MKLFFRIIRIAGFVLVLLGCLPFFWSLETFVSNTFGDSGYSHVEKITKQTYEQLEKLDDIYDAYTGLPYGGRVSEVYVKYAFDGDASVTVYVEVPQEHIDEFRQWIKSINKIYAERENRFVFNYFDSSNNYYFDHLVSNKIETNFVKIYWCTIAAVLLALMIPYECLLKSKKGSSS